MSRGFSLRDYLRTAAALPNGLHADQSGASGVDDQTPLRSELFSADQMELHGSALARAHALSRSQPQNRLLQRLDENERVLIDACELLTATVKSKRRIAPAGVWLLDNFYLIEEQIRTARRHLPKDYSRGLPRLAQGPSRGLPRVYDIALEAISHGDGRIDSETLCRFVSAYQSVVPLTLGELWAIPIMLRIALIENLRRVAARVTASRIHLDQARDWASKMMQIAESDPKSLILVIADMARSNPPMVSSFVAELARRLQGHGPALALPLTWVEQRLAESSQTIDQLVRSETQQQAADQVSISNTIASLRYLGATDWREFVESMSVVERILREDPGDAYRRMDFATRDRYRHVIARLAKGGGRSEDDVARAAIGLARAIAAIQGQTAPEAHVGYYLLDRGIASLETAIRMRLSVIARVRRLLGATPLFFYLAAILSLTTLFSLVPLALAREAGVEGWRLAALAVLSVLGASQLASALTNWLASLFRTPKPLPKMDFSRGLPQDLRTFVVVPTLLSSVKKVDELLEALEVRFLANRDEHLHFGLLTDFCDAQEESLPEDESLLRRARNGIELLNERFRSDDIDRFFLLHRPRKWNPRDRTWMGYERKRGKLADLNALLRGSARERFSLIVGDVAALSGVKYVITLDTDTQLPLDAARQCVATMAHPLNRPQYDGKKQRVIRGYGILQPRMGASLSGRQRSLYARLFGSEPGIDPYTRTVSDVYQDLFGEGSFIGKGIYDVDAFECSLGTRFPENRILSHDLLEGCYARSGLLSDVHLYEDYPSRYDADARRQERWIRGDWQIARWLLTRVPGPANQVLPNPLSRLSHWKILDNLRRSLVPAALLLLLLFGWFSAPAAGWWTLAVASIVLIPPLSIGIVGVLRRREDALLIRHLAAALRSAGQSLGQAGFRIACLPHEAVFSLAAVLRTAWRMLVTKRRLLEWSAYDDYQPAPDLAASYRSMASSPLLATLAALGLATMRPPALAVAAPVIALWLASPLIAWWLSRPLVRRRASLAPEHTTFLRRIARKTWGYFEQFVVASDHWLPPDNFQEHPGPAVAHRTSPTNMGLSQLANLAAWDFGYISAGTLIQRTKDAFQSMASLERHQGHFYNWYDTQTLRPLPPRYISSVDSGNLAGHLLTLRAGLLALPDQKIISERVFDGLADALGVLDSYLPESTGSQARQLRALLTSACEARAATLPAIKTQLESVERAAATLAAGTSESPEDDAALWAAALLRQARDVLDDLRFIAPWLELPAAPARLRGFADRDRISSLRQLASDAAGKPADIDGDLREEIAREEMDWLAAYRDAVATGAERARARIAACERLAQEALGLATANQEFLYDRARHLLAIGYNVDERRRDASFYDLLASESRLATFVAIAQGQLPQESWFALGRLLTTAGGEPVLVSWSGSMFEYLMPLLVMPAYDGTLLDQTCRAAVERQIAYGSQQSLPWGVSESGYNTVDANLSYQYHAFGVPGLGLTRGLAEDMVVAPYATALALMVEPEAACANLQRLAAAGMEGRYGFYEAVDYTPSRVERGQSSAIVRSYMAHHQGMNLLSLAHQILDRPMQRRFESDPLFKAALLLLEERIPKASAFHKHVTDHSDGSAFIDAAERSSQTPIGVDTATPEAQLLSNGRYHVMVTNAGGGYSRWRDFAVTRWREDTTRDNWGSFLYLRDTASGQYWSATHQPTLEPADSYDVMFSEGRAEFRRRDHGCETYSEIVVSPEDDIELRRVRVTNHSRVRRTIEVTSYAEVVLAPPVADAIQPSFGNLFVQTNILRARHAILCTRRPRSIGEHVPWSFHLLAARGAEVAEISYETDRMKFIGRGRTAAAPLALAESAALSGTEGSVLDPIVAIRCHVALEPGQSATLDFVSGAGGSREACLGLIEKYQDRHLADRVLDLAWTHSNVILAQINASTADAQLYRHLASSVLYGNAALRADTGVLMQNRRGQSGLWGYSISGDLPIVLVKIGARRTSISHAR